MDLTVIPSKAVVLNLGFATPPGVHGKISRDIWMAVEFSWIAIF